MAPPKENRQSPEAKSAQLHGVIIVDKHAGISSAGIVAEVKRILKAHKVGHAGTIDPFAEGVLVCCVNNATRLARFLLHGPKRYSAVLKLGVETDTQDATGTVIGIKSPVHLSEKKIRSIFKQYEGPGQQLPPVYSALKHKGIPLYKLARRGQPVQKPARQIHITDIIIQEIKIPQICFEVACSAGTYIRALCADIGRSLGCGGHLQALKRIESNGFTLSQAHTIDKIRQTVLAGNAEELIVKMADILKDMPEHYADRQLLEKIRHGRIIHKTDLMPGQVFTQMQSSQSYIKILDLWNNLVAVLDCRKDRDRLDYCCVFHN
jgi:tRNA pseudouridine55 synthase